MNYKIVEILKDMERSMENMYFLRNKTQSAAKVQGPDKPWEENIVQEFLGSRQ